MCTIFENSRFNSEGFIAVKRVDTTSKGSFVSSTRPEFRQRFDGEWGKDRGERVVYEIGKRLVSKGGPGFMMYTSRPVFKNAAYQHPVYIALWVPEGAVCYGGRFNGYDCVAVSECYVLGAL